MSTMKLTVKTKRYALNTACGCPRSAQSHCGINYLVEKHTVSMCGDSGSVSLSPLFSLRSTDGK